MTIKLDMSKTYDSMEWIFIEAIMAKLGFPTKWIQLIMQCVKTVSYSILIIGVPQERIKTTKGIQQSDPLSPYLFILYAKAFSGLLHCARSSGSISSVPISRGPIQINHLFFVDDSLSCCKANSIEWCNILHILERYERASEQALNKEKTIVFF